MSAATASVVVLSLVSLTLILVFNFFRSSLTENR